MSYQKKKKVAVIGAGPAGLVASQILSKRKNFDHVVFERNSDIGGNWLYTDNTELDEQGHRIHSPMYKNLITNFPVALMGLAGHPWPSDVDKHEFVPRQKVLDYLQQLADTDHYNLRQYIRTNTAVKLIRPATPKEKFPKVLITVENILDKSKEQFSFDSVLICTGGFTDPYMPKIDGLNKFRGEILHSCQYRCPQSFAGKHVVIVGGAASALDIGLELCEVTTITVCVSDRDVFNFKKQKAEGILPVNFMVAPSQLASVEKSSVKLTDGKSITADSILFCTGYKYSYPFLHPDCGITVEDFKVSPLFKHTVCTKHPNIMFIGLPYCPLISMACWQVPLALKILDGTLELPSEEEMNADTEAEIAEREKCESFTGKQTHYFILSEEFHPMRFIDDLAKLGGLPSFPEGLQYLPAQIIKNATRNVVSFRNEKYDIDGEMYAHHL